MFYTEQVRNPVPAFARTSFAGREGNYLPSCLQNWIPAFAGMTATFTGMTATFAGMTATFKGMTATFTGMTATFTGMTVLSRDKKVKTYLFVSPAFESNNLSSRFTQK